MVLISNTEQIAEALSMLADWRAKLVAYITAEAMLSSEPILFYKCRHVERTRNLELFVVHGVGSFATRPVTPNLKMRTRQSVKSIRPPAYFQPSIDRANKPNIMVDTIED